MPRNGSGVFSLPVPPFTPGTVILSADVNSDFSDIATALTGSIAADGQTPITGQLRGSQASAPTYSITGDLNTGFGSSSADTAYIQCGGINTLVCTTVGATITGNATVTGNAAITGTLTVTGDTIFGNVGSPFTVVSTNAGSGVEPILDLFRDSASPAVSDFLGVINFTGRNSAAAKITYARYYTQLTDPVSTSEDANFFLQAVVAGAMTTILQSSGADITIPGNLGVTGTTTGKATAPTVQKFLSGTAQTYTPTAGTVRIRVRMVGGGGGGGAQATNNGAVGTDTSFGSWTAIHGNGGVLGAPNTGGTGGTGGVDGTGTLIARISGANGGMSLVSGGVQYGASSALGGGANVVNTSSSVAKANTGSGGSGACTAGTGGGSGGGAGEYVEFFMTAAQIGVSQTYTVGGGGNGGAAGTVAGGNGAAGIIIIEEYYW